MVGLVVGWRIDTRAVQVHSRERPYGFRGQATGAGCGFGCGRGGMSPGVHWISSYVLRSSVVGFNLQSNFKFFATVQRSPKNFLRAGGRAVCASAGHGRAHHVHQPRAGRRPAHPGRPELLRLHRWVVEDAPSDIPYGFCSTITTGELSLLLRLIVISNTKAVMKVGR